MTEEETKEAFALLEKLEAKVAALIEYCKNSPTIVEASQKAKLHVTTEDAKKATHLIYQALATLGMSGITMKSVGQAQNELLTCAQQLRQVADRITLGVWDETRSRSVSSS